MDRKALREEKLKERYAFEEGRCGEYQLIYPAPGVRNITYFNYDYIG